MVVSQLGRGCSEFRGYCTCHRNFLRVWQDANQNGISDAGELTTLAQAGIVSINLASTAPGAATAVGGNQIVRTSTFTRADGSTSGIADVAFDISETATRWLGDTTISASAALLPQLRGFGEVKDLRVAMTGDAALQGMVTSFVANPSNENDAWREATFSLIAGRLAA